MTNILAIESSTAKYSLCLATDNFTISRDQDPAVGQSQLILPMIQSLLNEAGLRLSEINAIAVGRGPGSFTGVRVATSVAQGLGFGLDIPIYAISTLKSLAYEASLQNPSLDKVLMVPTLDARMRQLYCAAYSLNSDDLTRVADEMVIDPEHLVSKLNQINTSKNKLVVFGSGWEVYREQIQLSELQSEIIQLTSIEPVASSLAHLAKLAINTKSPGLTPNEVLPVYVRDNVVHS